MLLTFAGGPTFVAGLTFPADPSIVIRADAGVDVFSDNALHFAVLPPTTPSQQMRSRIERVRKDTDRAAPLCATTSTPSITAQTIE